MAGIDGVMREDVRRDGALGGMKDGAENLPARRACCEPADCVNYCFVGAAVATLGGCRPGGAPGSAGDHDGCMRRKK
ncbi:TPA: hypothetical protein QDC60_005620 [Burkholderia cenocepacia]|nr:hypothetical protein [Burkholderia cenocepacia]